MSTTERARISIELRERGMSIAWRQVDAARITDPVEQAEFLLRRLYPEMPEQWLHSTLARLAVLRDAGEWHGFRRPAP